MDVSEYIIIARGRLGPSWSSRLGGMRITGGLPDAPPRVKLEGHLPDQSALVGVIASLHDLGLEVELVTVLRDGSSTLPATAPQEEAGP